MDGGYTREERVAFSEIIWNNIIQSIQIILEAIESLEIPHQREPLQQEYHGQTIFMQPGRIENNFLAEVGLAVRIPNP